MKPRHLSDGLTTEVLQSLTEHRRDPWALSCELLIRCGCRTHELMSITRDSLNLTDGTIYIQACKGSNDRVVPVDKGCLTAVDEWLRLNLMPWQGYKPLTFKRRLQNEWVKLRLELLGGGLQHVTLHGLRATFAVRVYKHAGHDMLLVQELLGHRSLVNSSKYVRLAQLDEKKPSILRAFNQRRTK